MNDSTGCTPTQSDLVSFLNTFDARVSELTNLVEKLAGLASKLKPVPGIPATEEKQPPQQVGLVSDYFSVLIRLSNTNAHLLNIYDHLSKII